MSGGEFSIQGDLLLLVFWKSSFCVNFLCCGLTAKTVRATKAKQRAREEARAGAEEKGRLLVPPFFL